MAAGDVTFGANLTFNGEEARTGIIEKVYQKPSLTAIHTIEDNIVAKKQIAFLKRFAKVTLADAGCGTGKSEVNFDNTEKFWEPVDTKIWIHPCWSDFKASFFIWSMKKGINRADLNDTYLAEYIMDVMTDAIYEDLWRQAWLGDTDADEIAPGGTGVLLNASDIPHYNLYDGLFKQIMTGVTAGDIANYAISENAGVSFTAQALAADKAVTVLNAVIDNADQRLKTDPNAMILVTDSLFTNLKRYYQGKGIESTFRNLQTGLSEIMFDGYKVISIPIWDRYIRADHQDGTVWHLPHRAIMSTPENLRLGFDAYNGFEGIDSFLDKTTELYHVKGGYKVDAKMLEEYMVSAAGCNA